MKIRIAGFQLTLHSKFDFDTLRSGLEQRAGTKFRFQIHHRVLHVENDGDYVLGLLLTDRGHKNFVAIDTQTNELSRGSLGAKKNFGAFNFFVLCKKTNTALITVYRDAGGPSFVFGVLVDIGDKALEERKVEELKALGGGASNRDRQRVISNYGAPSLDWVEILGKEQFDAVLRKWKKIRAIEVAFASAKFAPAFVPGDDDALDRGVWRQSFKRGTKVSRAVDSIKMMWQQSHIKEEGILKVDGVDEWGIARRVEVEEKIPSLFGELDHDTIIADPTSFDQDLKMSYVIRHLKDVIRNAPKIFGS
jgi:hypothetical protein